MAYDEHLADRVCKILREKHVDFEEKKMMGGLCYMVNDKMCLGITTERLMARIDPEIYEDCLKKEGVSEMNFTGRAMKGFVFIEPEAIDRDSDLENWIQHCLDYNPKAKSSKKKK
jgi:TfoX/Sxy family transcriptional regulator of competence genes